MYRIFANVLKDLVTDWCVKKGKIPDTQFGFFPGRSTLYPLFILRHLRHAAKKLKPRNSPRLHVAFFFFLGGVTATAPSRDLTDNKKKEEGGLKQRRKQKEAAQGDPEPRKETRKKEKTQVEYRVEGAQDRRRRRKPGGWKETPNTRKRGGDAHSIPMARYT